jgi:hypothetical protein
LDRRFHAPLLVLCEPGSIRQRQSPFPTALRDTFERSTALQKPESSIRIAIMELFAEQCRRFSPLPCCATAPSLSPWSSHIKQAYATALALSAGPKRDWPKVSPDQWDHGVEQT